MEVNEYILKQMYGSGENKKILGVFPSYISYYVKMKYCNNKGIIYIIENILQLSDVKKVVLGDQIKHSIKESVIKFLSSKNISFSFSSSYDEKNEIALIFLDKDEEKCNFIEYKPNINEKILLNMNSEICKDCYERIVKLDPTLQKYFKKTGLFGKKECNLCDIEF